MKIAMIGVKAVPALGGICTYVEEMGWRLAERGHEVVVYCRPEYLQGVGGQYRAMDRIVTRGLRGKHLDALTHTFTASLHASRRHYDVIHIHGSAPGVVMPLLKLLDTAPVLVTIHGLDWRGAKWGRAASRLMAKAAHLTAKHGSEIVAVSQYVQREFEAHTGRSGLCIPTGVDLFPVPPAEQIRALGLEPGRFLFSAGRFVPEKGLHCLIEAFEKLEADVKLVIGGGGGNDDGYARQLRSTSDERVVFPGYVTGQLLAELYAHCYAYVQPSLLEGASMALLEAMSYGRCVIASDIPPNVEALGPRGRTFRSGDVASLLEALNWALATPDVVAAEFRQAREYVRLERSWERTVDEYEAVYTSLIGARSAARTAQRKAVTPRIQQRRDIPKVSGEAMTYVGRPHAQGQHRD